ncbi:hypothetical protein BKA67DRAFT_552193 [Truncatella angustata]|uniref:Cupin type-1 domain-containing protein n=1 Tax=Truncatella angustata TaxID=152316 RepID=A0A9P8UQC3_9PEZI|nr:uncharacterized protein BKA67DRAFT_552193 [Truncatella angustata]KAH6656517.1 hypothetical protein BKA67DRAFT_552193 [Truncatella angustata]KAH8195151.1 hypothetical protein TruAng_010676 [Truncatella angustata]
MAQPRKYRLPPTALIPNSPNPLLYYSGLFSEEVQKSPNTAATTCFDIFEENGWSTQWIFRYGKAQTSHYHSAVHECMVVLTGSAHIRFGVADTVDDLEESTYGSGREQGGVEVEAKAGDVFVIPAGVAHKTFDSKPEAEFKLLTPGQGHSIEADDRRSTLAKLELTGFTMMGAYPIDSRDWDFAKGGEDVGRFEKVWATSKPHKDPVLGDAENGLIGTWS